METHTFFLYLLVILISARLFAELAVRLNAPPVIGELVAGVVLGPSLFGWVEPHETIRLLAEIGVIMLLFEVGLETDLKRLVRTGAKSLAVALIGFFLPLLLGFLLSRYLFSLSLIISLFIGGTLTATSIGITVRVLTDLGRQQSTEGQVVLGAAVIDDVMGVLLLALLYEFSTEGGVNFVNAGKALIFITAFFVLAPVVANLNQVAHQINMNAERLPAGLVETALRDIDLVREQVQALRGRLMVFLVLAPPPQSPVQRSRPIPR